VESNGGGVRWWVAQTSPLTGPRDDGIKHLEPESSHIRSHGKPETIGWVDKAPTTVAEAGQMRESEGAENGVEKRKRVSRRAEAGILVRSFDGLAMYISMVARDPSHGLGRAQ
jgi:hypothetical protein